MSTAVRFTVDEFDRMDLNNLGLARDRLMGQANPIEINTSTPTFPGLGIDHEFSKSDQRRWLLECPNCKERRALSFASISLDEVDYDNSFWKCSACAMRWSEEQKQDLVSKGSWVANNPSAKVRGYHLPALYSAIQPASFFARRYFDSRASETQIQIFYNSILGEAYAPEGSRITEEMIFRAQNEKPYKSHATGQQTAIGIDVGALQHYVVCKRTEVGIEILKVGTVPTIDDLKTICKNYKVASLVIDGQPERQKAREFIKELNLARWRSAWMCFYPEMKVSERWDAVQSHVELHRTEAIDKLVSNFKDGRIRLPLDIPEDYRLHLRSMVRVNEPDPRSGNMIGRWRESGPDHFAHASVYAMTAASRLVAAETALGIWV